MSKLTNTTVRTTEKENRLAWKTAKMMEKQEGKKVSKAEVFRRGLPLVARSVGVAA